MPPFALAAGANLTYYASEAPSPSAQAIVVRQDSPIHSVTQLKGQRVAFARGAGAHYLLLEELGEGDCRCAIEMRATGQRIDMDVMTSQARRREAGGWRQVTFQATNR